MKKILHVISHTHWDREWYLSYEDFRIRLVDMIDRLLNYLERDQTYHAFMLDGHTALVLDYLEIRPYKKELLKKYIREQRILIGPWYILPDEVLISGESHIRNFLMGASICREMSGSMNIGYLPDAFGHPSQMPQILKKLGLNEIVFWRGMPDSIQKNEFVWEAPDGESLLAINLPYGYGNCPHLPNEKEAFLRRIRAVADAYEGKSWSGVIPIMNGRDHLEAQECITDMLAALKDQSEEYEIIHSTLPEFVRQLREQLEPEKLQHYKGEMRSSDRTLLLGGTLSTRIYLKQHNEEVTRLYERWVEPFTAADRLLGHRNYPRDLIRQGWKYILQNHPHDSICGCSIDEVHQEMEVRFLKARQIGRELCSRSLHAVTGSQVTDGNDEAWIAVFNPLAYSRSALITCTVEFYPQLHNHLNYQHMNQREYYPYEKENAGFPVSVILEDSHGNRCEAILNRAYIGQGLWLSTEEQPKEYKCHCYEITFTADQVPAFGFKAYRVIPRYDVPSAQAVPEVDSDDMGRFIENTYYRVEFQDGKLNIYDKELRQSYEDCARLVDSADAGDEYTYSYIENDHEIRIEPASVKISTDGPANHKNCLTISGVMNLPKGLTEDENDRRLETIACAFTMKVMLQSLAKRIDFNVTFDNQAEDHRLRVLFPTMFYTDHSWAQNAFSVDRHMIRRLSDMHGTEIFYTDCQKEFVSIDDGHTGISIFNKGLPEYELVQTGSGSALALTLLRCVAYLSKAKMPTRTGDAGWNVETPMAQCPGIHEFEFAFTSHTGTALKNHVPRMAQEYSNPLKFHQLPAQCRPAREECSLIQIDQERFLLSAVKLAELSDDDLIVRFYNCSEDTEVGTVRFGFPVTRVQLCDLKEDPISELDICDNQVELSAKGWEIISLRIGIGQ
ncbi:alpha-mannosidase [Diplocloster agilis]|uniref:Glycoside hydrolase family 38 central domain-containing protein n=1 Tax=Diplocloster agilis TaxID=2850323 RepID=A0A949NH17_9FIRM|nr:glycosyl hydrolase-related protein [Diplocloster agilis]MBU9737463.1 hypothetical protein [Diplocloster agilis]